MAKPDEELAPFSLPFLFEPLDREGVLSMIALTTALMLGQPHAPLMPRAAWLALGAVVFGAVSFFVPCRCCATRLTAVLHDLSLTLWGMPFGYLVGRTPLPQMSVRDLFYIALAYALGVLWMVLADGFWGCAAGKQGGQAAPER